MRQAPSQNNSKMPKKCFVGCFNRKIPGLPEETIASPFRKCEKKYGSLGYFSRNFEKTTSREISANWPRRAFVDTANTHPESSAHPRWHQLNNMNFLYISLLSRAYSFRNSACSCQTQNHWNAHAGACDSREIGILIRTIVRGRTAHEYILTVYCYLKTALVFDQRIPVGRKWNFKLLRVFWYPTRQSSSRENLFLTSLKKHHTLDLGPKLCCSGHPIQQVIWKAKRNTNSQLKCAPNTIKSQCICPNSIQVSLFHNMGHLWTVLGLLRQDTYRVLFKHCMRIWSIFTEIGAHSGQNDRFKSNFKTNFT